MGQPSSFTPPLPGRHNHEVGGVALLSRLATRRETPADLDVLRAAAQTVLRNGGEVSLGRCLRLPCSPRRFTLEARDHALLQVHEQLGLPGAVEVRRRLMVFERCLWRQWRGDPAPPADSAELHHAMFWALRHGAGKVLSVKQLGRILGRTPKARDLSGECGQSSLIDNCQQDEATDGNF